MPKNEYSKRDDLVCGKIDGLYDLLKDGGLVDEIHILDDIRRDCNRMEVKLISRKDEVAAKNEQIKVMRELLSTALKALCLTRDYVGAETLPAVDGWEWYEAGKALSLAIPEDEWTTQFAIRVVNCPQCKSDTGLKFPRGLSVYCEDCGWPDEDFGAEDPVVSQLEQVVKSNE